MKKRCFIAFVLVITFVLSGCTNSNSGAKDNTIASGDTVGKKVMEYNVTYKSFDMPQACNMLLSNYDVNNIPEPSGDTKLVYIENGEEKLVTNSGGFLNYSENDTADELNSFVTENIFNASYTTSYKLNASSDVENVIFEKCNKLISLLFVDSDDDFTLKKTMVRDVKGIKGVITAYNSEGGPLQIEADSFEYNYDKYTFLLYELKKDGIPLYGPSEQNQGYEYEGNYPTCSYISILCGDDKIIAVNSQEIFSYDSGKEKSIISSQEAKSIAKEESEMIACIDDEELSAELEYVDIPDITTELYTPNVLEPYWKVTKKDAAKNDSVVRINAFTGGDMAYGE